LWEHSLICIFIAIQNYKYSGDLHLQKQVGLKLVIKSKSNTSLIPDPLADGLLTFETSNGSGISNVGKE